MQIVTIAATKSGVGKTTMTVCVALEAKARGVDAWLVDVDPQGSASKLASIQSISTYLGHATSAEQITGAAAGHQLVDLDLIVPTRRDGRRSIHALGLEQLRSNEWLAERVTDFVPASTSVEWLEGGRPLPELSPVTLAYRLVLDRVLAELETKAEDEGA